MVLEISCGKFRALFPGDLEGPGEREVLPAIRRVHLLKVAHHGSAYSSAEAFLARAGAPVSLISSAEHSIYHHPHKDTLERLRRAGSRYFCTKDAGAVLVTVKDGKMTVREYKKERKKH
jgi:competence protein ComEC